MGPRLAAYGVAGAVLLAVAVGAWVTIAGWRRDSLALAGVQMRLAAEIAASTTERRLRADVLKGYTDEIATLRAASARPARAIRVCDNLPAAAEPGAAAGRNDDPGAAAGELSPGAGRDIGPALYAEADRADELAARLRALQEWAREVSAPLE